MAFGYSQRLRGLLHTLRQDSPTMHLYGPPIGIRASEENKAVQVRDASVMENRKGEN